MEFTSPSIVKELFKKYKIKPSKGLGQNFLIDKRILDKIISSAELKKDDLILEVGPGIGNLTKELAKRVGQVIAVEKDKKMVEILKENLIGFNNIKIIQEDILKLKIDDSIKKYKVVANIPYYLTSPLIRKFLENKKQPQEMILMIQKEVAQRVIAKPPKMNLLAISVQFYANAKIISYVSKNCFWPIPKIDSAIIKITPNKKYDIDPNLFFKVVKAGFSHPRKQLVNNLITLKFLNGVKLDKYKVTEWLLNNKLKPIQRPETLYVSDWIKLTKKI